ncbi:protein phosphatase 2C domain-containing protein [Pelomonas sp. V22]|uniref:PP2C family protein-serine/threonine phosphatase n=1 Tax=Pelomonas sp. V22 TaxID=2822139 RepID=UPI0024A90D11|nr:protein phosphatase 2C domain-containing protein [Pelomonas sp. V22]MDI4632631.1 protein phosphatase 2C domain-containing protein [Pelomonas sp. V22]
MSRESISSFSVPVVGRQNFDAEAHLLSDDGDVFIAIADGVGSSQYGGDAARLAISTALEFSWTLKTEEIFAKVSDRIQAAAIGNEGQWSTTLTTCRVRGKRVEVGHVGDTRLYHIRGAGLLTRTRDQTEVAKLIEEGVLTPERALRYPRRHVLLSAMSSSGTYELECSDFEVELGDRLLLLTDGLYKQVSKKEIVAASVSSESVSGFLGSLEDLLLSKGVVDDATAVCAEIR